MDVVGLLGAGRQVVLFREKGPKSFCSPPAWRPAPALQAALFAEPAHAQVQAGSKSFLVLFLEKGLLAFLPACARSKPMPAGTNRHYTEKRIPMNGDTCELRIARPADADGITAVLASAYPELMAPHYDPAILAITLPMMTTANPGLLASGRYYVQVAPQEQIVACGGWTHEEPGTGKSESGVAHIRHFATHLGWIRKGLGTGIFRRCRQDALAEGIHTFRCSASLNAEPFYASLGLSVVDRADVLIAGARGIPTITMVWIERLQKQESK